MGRHPFATDRYDSIFAQLNAIVNESVSPLDSRFSQECQHFINRWYLLSLIMLFSCVHISLCKDPKQRAHYPELLSHPFIVKYTNIEVDMKSWACQAYEAYQEKKHSRVKV